jgi:hypothetical protein
MSVEDEKLLMVVDILVATERYLSPTVCKCNYNL